MAITETSAKPIRVYAAHWLYWVVLGALTGLCVMGSAYVSAHNQKVSVLMWFITGLYLLALATVVTLRIGLTNDGLTQRWLFSRLQVKWSEVARVEKMARAYALRDAKGTNLVLLFLLPLSAQQALAEEAVTRARLRPGKAAAKAPVLQFWERRR